MKLGEPKVAGAWVAPPTQPRLIQQQGLAGVRDTAIEADGDSQTLPGPTLTPPSIRGSDVYQSRPLTVS